MGLTLRFDTVLARVKIQNKGLEEAVGRVVRHSIPTLRWITIRGGVGQDGRARVAPIVGELVLLSSKRHRVAPRLKRVELVAGATGVAKAGKAVAAGLWPALEVLSFSHCRGNAGHFKDLADGLRAGRAPFLRALEWDDQSSIRKRPVDDVILSALAGGMCPRLESLSFKDNHLFCPEYSIFYLKDALRACPNLRVLAMDCSRTPCRQLHDLARALRKGWMPKLDFLYVRATAPYRRSSDVELKALREAVASREPPVMLVSEIKTRLPAKTQRCRCRIFSAGFGIRSTGTGLSAAAPLHVAETLAMGCVRSRCGQPEQGLLFSVFGRH